MYTWKIEGVNIWMSVWMNVKGLEDENGHQNWKQWEGGICNKNDIIRAMHGVWSYNIFCLGRSNG